MAINHRGRLIGRRRPRRIVHWDGVIEEWHPVTGRTFTIPARPRRDPDLSADSAGWEAAQTYLARLRGR